MWTRHSKKRNLFFSQKKGFTMIEMIVVIFIISLLAGIVYVNVNRIRMKARDLQRLADIRLLESQINRYYAINHHYPEPAVSDNTPFQCAFWDIGNDGTDANGQPHPFIPQLESFGSITRNPRERTLYGDGSDVCFGYTYGYRKSIGTAGALCNGNKATYVLTVLFEETQAEMGLPDDEITPLCCAGGGVDAGGDTCSNDHRFGILFKEH